jgi:hypothetical protein
MIYRFYSDASYLSEPKARSRAASIHYLTNSGADPLINGVILVLSQTLDVVVSSSCEAEYGTLYTNGRAGIQIRNTLADLGFPQDATIGEADNRIAVNLVNDDAKQRRAKAIDMRYHWMRDRVRQKQFKIIWRPGTDNLADFPSKIHPTPHFLAVRPFYVSYPSANSNPIHEDMRGCVDLAAAAPPVTEHQQTQLPESASHSFLHGTHKPATKSNPFPNRERSMSFTDRLENIHPLVNNPTYNRSLP